MGDKPKKPHWVIAKVDVTPDDIRTDEEMEEIKQKMIDVLKPLKTDLEAAQIVPVAFGLRKWHIQIAIPEETEGGTQPAEDALGSIEGIQRVEVGMVART
ncbi:MAG: elongation factor 1-beta [archaeon]|nr:elongation factor 1-beta [archaeon]